jgi:HK97 family phage prohead protease
MTKKKRKTISCNMRFKATDQGNGSVILEGWANAATVDRGGEILRKESWILQNYLKNPIILFNHDRDKPVGRALAVEARDQGLYVKVLVSSSDDEMVSYVRDLCAEGILNSFSVGFQAIQESKDADGNLFISQAELFEISIVTLPMNQDSTFSVTTKDLRVKTMAEARQVVLHAKGAKVAELVQARLSELGKDDQFDRGAALDKVAAAGSVNADSLGDILAGKGDAVPASVLAAFVSVLGVDKAALEAAAKADAGTKPDAGETPPAKEVPPMEETPKAVTPPEEKAPPAPPAPPAPAEGGAPPPPAAAPAKKDPMAVVQALYISKGTCKTIEEAKAMAEAAGFKGDKIADDGEYWCCEQCPVDSLAPGDLGQVPVGKDGDESYVTVGLTKMPEAAAPPAPDAAKAEVPCDECMTNFTKEALTSGKPQNEAVAYAHAKCQKACGASSEPSQKSAPDGTGTPTTPIPGNNAGTIDESPALAQAKQTNVLLGQLIGAVQGMSAKLDKVVDASAADAAEDAAEAAAEDPAAATKAMLVAMDLKLKSIGV